VVDTNIRRVLARAVGGQAQPAPPSTARDLAAMEALLPEDPRAAQRFNAGMMELGALICTSSSPRCEDCPIAERCAWRQAGYPHYTGARRAVQKRYEGSDRQVRGVILHALRAADGAVASARLQELWPDAAQRDRALASLVTDGLAVAAGDGYRLP
jgi:A/G-specific adenine glycosylase